MCSGRGGVGKTTLLKEFAGLAETAGIPAIRLDGRNIEPSPDLFLHILGQTLGLTLPGPAGAPLVEALAAPSGRQVILIDTYEALLPLDGWLREVFLPQLPDNTLIVLAGRVAPAAGWRADPGWQDMIRVLPLRNLNPAESRAYLTRREIPADQHQEVLDFTHGHPLALSLVADLFAQRGTFRFQPEAAPDIVRVLLEQLVQKVPGPAHRTALEACALVRLLTEDLLSQILDMPDPHELFEWLRGLSFIESGPLGLFPHDLAREALVADLHWRNPTWYAELHRRARLYYSNAFQTVRDPEQQRVLFDLLFLHRDNIMVRPFVEWQESGSVLPDVLHDGDRPLLRAIVARHEGEESAALADYWFTRQPEGVLVFRDGEGRPTAFLAMVALAATTDEDRQRDPATAAAWHYLHTSAPLRPGDSATLFRFWMAHESYQGVSAEQSLLFMNIVRHYLTQPRLTLTFLPFADPDFFAPLFAYADIARLPEADFTVGGRAYGVYTRNWRASSPVAWLALLAEREIAAAAPATAPPARPAPLVVLSEQDFAAAVRDALRDYTRAAGLNGNPLLQSRLVMARADDGAGTAERVAVLQAILKQACATLEASPQEAKLYRALYHTYLQPAPTQELAAERLDLPFSTFRRHLKTGTTRLAEILWQWELQETGT